MSKTVFVNRYFAPDHSATSQMLSDLAFSLREAGLDVHIITSRQRYDDPSARLPTEELLGNVAVHRIWTSTFGRGHLVGRACDYFSFYLSVGLRLLLLLRRGDIVVAKTDPPLLSVVAGVCAQFRGAMQVNWLQDLFPEVAGALGMRVAGGRLGRLLLVMRNWSLRRAEMNVAIIDLMADRIRAQGVAPQHLRVIPNWSDGQAVKPLDPLVNPLRQQWGLGEKFVVGYSGNMGRAHDFNTVLQAAELLQSDSEICFLFIGGGKQREFVESEARRLELNNVLFQPYQPRQHLGWSLPAADTHIVSLLPELEGLSVPSKFYGVAAAGRPTIFIGDRAGGIGTVVREAECGVCVQQGDAAALVAAIRTLHKDGALRERMSDNARRVFEERFDKPVASERWRCLLQRVREKGVRKYPTPRHTRATGTECGAATAVRPGEEDQSIPPTGERLR